MPVSDIFAKPRVPVDLPRFEEFEAGFSSRVRNAQNEEELRHIGTIVRAYLEQGLITQARANELWNSMLERSNVLRSIYTLSETVRRTFLDTTDVFTEAWAGVTSPSHEGKRVTKYDVPASLHPSAYALAAAMKQNSIQDTKIGSARFQTHQTLGWQFIPHVVPVTNYSSEEETTHDTQEIK